MTPLLLFCYCLAVTGGLLVLAAGLLAVAVALGHLARLAREIR